MSRRVIGHIVEQHGEDAAFLWLQRDRAVDAPDQHGKDVARLDDRLEAHVDGLRVAGEWGWQIAERAFDQYREPGETFVAAVLAFESRSENRIGYVLNLAETSPALFRATVSALGWVDQQRLRGTISTLLDETRPSRRLLGLAACSVRRINPPDLARFLSDVPAVRARALRLAGEVGRADLLSDLRTALDDPDETCRFWAAWSCTLLGDRHESLEVLRTHAGTDGLGWKGVQLLLRVEDHQKGVDWLLSLRGNRSKERLIAAGTGILGDAIFVPWLTTRMRDPKLARLAGESFSTITGISLQREGMYVEPPVGIDSADASADEHSARDEDLVWPDVRKIREWWRHHQTDFIHGRRYLLGKPLPVEKLTEIFANGPQRLRRGAALELALSAPDAPLANCSARSPH